MATVRVTGRVTKIIEHVEGKLDNGNRWAHSALMVSVNDDESVKVKFPEGTDLSAFAKGSQVDFYCDTYKPSLKFEETVAAESGVRRASA